MTPSTPSLHPTRDRRSYYTAAGQILLLLGALLLGLTTFLPGNVQAQDGTSAQVLIIPIEGAIEPGLGHFLDRVIDEAEENGVTTIILDINTPGGRLDTVLEMRDTILDTDIPVIAFVNREAFSAGALITIASDEIWMTPGAVFGAATPIDGATGETASEKTISAVRSVFHATAEEQGRDPLIAEAMVDPSVTIEGLDSSTSLLTLTTEQALEYDYSDGAAANGTVLLKELGLSDATVQEAEMTLWERAVGWITSPVVASLLVLLGLALIVVDGLVAGFGVVAAIGLACLGLFFWGHLLAGLAGWEDLLLIALGLVLIALEAFVIPGFGVAGVAGLLALGGGLVLAMTRREFGDPGFASEVADALTVLLITLAATLAVIAASVWLLPKMIPSRAMPARRWQGLTLSATVNEGGRAPYQPGALMRFLGGAETVGRDDRGHTATSRKEDPIRDSAESPGNR
jgi:membrane-bound serine protease (ClpP class)